MPVLIIGSLICFVIVLFFKIRDKTVKADTYGSDLFDGRVPKNNLTKLEEFGTKNNTIVRTILVLFDPECEACYSLIQNILRNRERLNNSHLILASAIPKDQILSHTQKFDFSEFNSVGVYVLNSDALRNNVISYPTIIIYNVSGEYIKGFRGNVKLENIDDLL